MQHIELFEQEYLSRVIELVRAELASLREQAEIKQDDILRAKEEIRGETSHSISNLWRSDNFEQLVELSQFATMISNDITSYESIIKNIGQLELQLSSPYFARIDFTFDSEHSARMIYIGRFTLMDGHSIAVYDWRSPIAGMFYRFGLGRASYSAPMGEICGEITLKRQYEVKNGELEYYFDADVEVLDEYLRTLLAKNTSPQMKNIVETIQREQDTVIRDDYFDALIVQGVAGSGKTSIALHRAAYLMYSGMVGNLSSQHIAIISPHSLFEQYISNVLPELGEENINSFLIDEILSIVINSAKIQSKHALFESIITGDAEKAAIIRNSLEFKTSRAFIDMLDKLDTGKGGLPEIIDAYRQMFADRRRFKRLAAHISLPKDIEEIVAYTNENLESRRLFFDDASVLTYLCLKSNGFDELRHIRHVIIDEAQDYYPLHFEIFKLLFPNARYTILGDVNQTVEKTEKQDFYDEVKGIFSKIRLGYRASVITLGKSFRCAAEIMQFAASLIGADIKAFGRHTAKPAIHKLSTIDDLSPVLIEIDRCRNLEYKSIGIICKSEREANKLYQLVRTKMDIRLITDADIELSGVFVLPVYLSKGMEFDAVLLWGADAESYHSIDDKKLLYIACTRALHSLSLYYWGELSPLIPT